MTRQPIVLTSTEPRRHVRCRTPGPCVHCTVETHWAETTYAEPLHPGHCTDVWDAAYDETGITRGPWRPFRMRPVARCRLAVTR